MPHNLPLQLTSFIGRERELATVAGLVRTARLVTLTGAGGSGKTRLALQAAADLGSGFADGVCFVSLAPIRDPSLVVSVVAQVLDVRETGNTPLVESLTSAVGERSLLLVLDNFEQVLEAAPLVTELLTACPALRVLVTSRSALRLRGERELPVPPLALPERGSVAAASPATILTRYAAVALFVDRALAVKPDLAITDETATTIAEICARLDGLPLAIELAAARCKLLSPRAMLARLGHRLALLAGGPRDLPERQRTLRDAIAWSYDLLTAEEQDLFRRLAVFAGGCSLDAIEAVAASGAGAVLELVASLVDKSLLRQSETAGSEPRFAMLETVREFGQEALAAGGEADATRQRHAEYFLALAEAAEPFLGQAEQEGWLDRLEREHDNMRAALRCCIDHDQGEFGLRLAGALAQFWQFRGYLAEGRAWLDSALRAGGNIDANARARALAGAGMLALYQGDYAIARACHEESLAIYRRAGDLPGAAMAINDLGTIMLHQSDYGAASAYYEESLAIRREIGDRRGTAVSLTNLGLVAQARGEFDRARSLHEQSLSIRRELGDRQGIARALSRFGIVATEQGDFATARAALLESVGVARELGDKQAMGWSLTNLGAVALEQGDLASARSLLEEGLAIRRQLGNRAGIPRTIWHLIHLAELEGNDALARELWEEGLEIARDAGDRRGTAIWLSGLGDLLLRLGDHAGARAFYEESLTLRRELGERNGAAIVLSRLAQTAHAAGDTAQARSQLEESVALLRELGEHQALAASLTNLAQLLLSAGDYAAAQALYLECLALPHQYQDAGVASLCLAGLATVSLAEGRSELAARLFGAAEAAAEGAGAPLSAGRFEQELALTAAGIEAYEQAFAAARAAGHALTLEQAIDLAVDAPPDRPAHATDTSAAAAAYPSGLTQREVDVLRLIAAGRSTREIADALVISAGTVERHITNLYGKIGARGRGEATAFAFRYQLVP
jgi:predicted ATPase/DNA-binding CsgD family transcriptional regulator